MTLGIIGGGRGGLEMLKLLADSELVAVAYMVDQDPRAVGMVEAKRRGIATHTDLVVTMRRHRTDFIIEATGSAKVTEIITQNLTAETELISSKASLIAYSGRKRPAFRRENGHHSDGKTAGVPIGMRPPFR